VKIHKTVLVLLYSVGLSFALLVAIRAYSYYDLPLKERPRSQLHRSFKPGGKWGHGLGVLGSSMMLLLFLYSVRKRRLFGLRFGKVGQWLNIHIFLGILGPILVTLHTAFKFGGIVSLSYYSMLAVMLSGFVGRFLYVQIPRTLSGDALTLKEMQERDQALTRLLVEDYRLSPHSISELRQLTGLPENSTLKGVFALFAILKNDFVRPFRMKELKGKLRRQSGTVPVHQINSLIKTIDQKAVLMRKMALLSSIQPLFHYWHVIHKPFAYVMVIIMFLHVGVTILFGFRWIF